MHGALPPQEPPFAGGHCPQCTRAQGPVSASPPQASSRGRCHHLSAGGGPTGPGSFSSWSLPRSGPTLRQQMALSPGQGIRELTEQVWWPQGLPPTPSPRPPSRCSKAPQAPAIPAQPCAHPRGAGRPAAGSRPASCVQGALGVPGPTAGTCGPNPWSFQEPSCSVTCREAAGPRPAAAPVPAEPVTGTAGQQQALAGHELSTHPAASTSLSPAAPGPAFPSAAPVPLLVGAGPQDGLRRAQAAVRGAQHPRPRFASEGARGTVGKPMRFSNLSAWAATCPPPAP